MAKLSIDERIKALTAQKERADKIAKAKSDIAAAKKTLESLKKKKWSVNIVLVKNAGYAVNGWKDVV